MNKANTQIRVRGKTLEVPSIQIDGQTVAVTGKWLKIASIKDEGVVEGEPVGDPALFVARLSEGRLKADLFTFSQKAPEVTPKFDYTFEWDNLAAMTITTFDDWWKRRIKDKTRNMVRKAQKSGVSTRMVAFDEDLVRGIMEIYNETPIRQGRNFWHYGKDFDTVKHELSTYLDRGHFIGAYFNEELIGFMKLVSVNQTFILFHFLSKNEHRDKSPMNALIAKAVEFSAERGIQYLIYGRFTYGNKTNSPLAEFKQRNGFQKIEIPKYYIPLTLKGQVALKLKLHRGLLGILPPGLLTVLVNLRAKILQRRSSSKSGANQASPGITPKTLPAADKTSVTTPATRE